MENDVKNKADRRSMHLQELKGSDFKIVDEMADIQGWKITDSDGVKIGKVRDMLFDRNAEKVRYIITILEGEDQEVLIPIGKTRLVEDQKTVIVEVLKFRQLKSLPIYVKDNLTWDDEYDIQDLFQFYESKAAERGKKVYNHDTFYDNEDFNQEHLYRKNLENDRYDEL